MSTDAEREALTADDISLTQTCFACPEQYDAYDPDGRQVGYLRLRHGWFTVDMPDAAGTEVYSAQPLGDGVFDPDEREGYLRTAREKIAEHLNAIPEPPMSKRDILHPVSVQYRVMGPPVYTDAAGRVLTLDEALACGAAKPPAHDLMLHAHQHDGPVDEPHEHFHVGPGHMGIEHSHPHRHVPDLTGGTDEH